MYTKNKKQNMSKSPPLNGSTRHNSSMPPWTPTLWRPLIDLGWVACHGRNE